MNLHIGKLIKKHLEEVGMSKAEFARRINTTSQNVYGIFKRKSVDSGLLQKISHVLNFNLFHYFLVSEDFNELKEPAITYRSVNDILKELNETRKELELIKTENVYLKKIVELMEHDKKKI